MTDTHVHLNIDPLFAEARAHADAAEDTGVRSLVIPGFDRESTRRAILLAEADPRCHAIAGWHPGHCAEWGVESAAEMRDAAEHPAVVAIGEIGLDFFRGATNSAEQESCFREQLEIAGEVGLPIVLHCRPTEGTWDTLDRMIEILEVTPHPHGVVWHCFQGTLEHARRIMSAGAWLGFDGPVTYRRNQVLREIAADVPLDRILLETDAPYLSPEPHRGAFPNVPARLGLIANAVAGARGMSLEDLERATDANALRAFPRLGNQCAPAAI
ncbi:MAG: TatD family hydrolase [Armatimonadota bacterium]